MVRSWLPVLGGLLLAMPLLTGCLAEDAPKHPPVGPTPTQTPSPPDETSDSPPREIPFEVFWSDCHGIRTAFTFPLDTNPVDHPPGWEPEGRAGSELGVEVYECQRVSWGPFERGPVHFLFELHGELDPPEKCTEGDPNFIRAFTSFWTDDASLGQYLDDVYDLPVIVGNFTETVTSNPETREIHWVWNTNGSQPSEVSVHTVGEEKQSWGGNLVRMYWFNATHLSYMDIDDDVRGYKVSSILSPGTMSEPMVFSRTGLPFMGRSVVITEGDMSGKIKTFEGFDCEKQV